MAKRVKVPGAVLDREQTDFSGEPGVVDDGTKFVV
jgi:hypothetical protein